MSTFFRALEQAERERALRDEARRAQETGAAPASAPPDALPPPSPAPPTAQAPPTAPPPSPAPASAAAAPRHRAVPAPPAEPPDSLDGVESHLVSLLHPASFQAEPYRALRHLIEQRHRAGQLSIVALSSAGIGDGKTTTAINLAGALAQAPDARVLLVDADLRRSSVARLLALDGLSGRGLVDAILDPALALEDVVSSRPAFNLDVLPAGREAGGPYELLKSPRLGELQEEARRRYDYVVLDTAPLVPVPDTRLLGKLVDGFLLVVAAHRTPRKLVAEALNLMDPARLVGLVFNGDDQSMSGYYSYGYGYGYGASANGHSRGGWRDLWRRPLGAGREGQAPRRRHREAGPGP